MTINNCSELLTRIQSQISGISSTQSAKELTLLSAAVSQATNNRQVSVASSNELPDIRGNNISNGQMIFLEDRLIPVIANNECWLGLDGRVLRSDAPTRTLFSWGRNLCGSLGDGTTVDRCSPGTIFGGGTTWRTISSGLSNAGAIKTDGTLWTWGSGQGSLGGGYSSIVSRCSPGTVSGGGTTWCLISIRDDALAIKTDGTLWCWGSCRNSEGGSNLVCIPKQADSSNLWCTGSTGTDGTSAAIKTDGTLWTWGKGSEGRLGNGTTVWRNSPGTVFGGGTTWCQVSMGRNHGAAIKTDGTLWTWGCNPSGQLGNGTTVSRCSPGTIWGSATNWCQVASGGCHTTAIKTDGTLWTWGCNGQGRLGDGTATNRCSPGTIFGGGTTWCQFFGGTVHTLAIKTDGTLWTWGCNYCGKLGDGTTVVRCSPGTVFGGGTNWSQISDFLALQVQ